MTPQYAIVAPEHGCCRYTILIQTPRGWNQHQTPRILPRKENMDTRPLRLHPTDETSDFFVKLNCLRSYRIKPFATGNHGISAEETILREKINRLSNVNAFILLGSEIFGSRNSVRSDYDNNAVQLSYFLTEPFGCK